jgi:hypothetical protein
MSVPTSYDPIVVLQTNTDTLLSILYGSDYVDGNAYQKPVEFDPSGNPTLYETEYTGATSYFGTTNITDVAIGDLSEDVVNYIQTKIPAGKYAAYPSFDAVGARLYANGTWIYNSTMYPDPGSLGSPPVFDSDNVRFGMRMAKHLYANWETGSAGLSN